MKTHTIYLSVAACLGLTTAASAAQLSYEAVLNDLNGIGASGSVSMQLDDVANTLTVNVNASGLAPDQTHVQHIHGVKNADGSNGNSVSPPPEADVDGDGFIELGEGQAFYGPIILSLTNDTIPGLGGFPTAPNGEIDFSYTYDLLDSPAYGEGFDITDLLDLEDREIVIHGAFTDFAAENQIPGLGGGILNDEDGNPISAERNYNAGLPVLSGELVRVAPVPLPASALLLVAGLGGFGFLRRKSA